MSAAASGESVSPVTPFVSATGVVRS